MACPTRCAGAIRLGRASPPGGGSRRTCSRSRRRSASPAGRTWMTGPSWASGPHPATTPAMRLVTATGVVPVKVLTVRKADLGKLVPLAQGGFGRVFRVDDFLLPGDPAPLAYKEFTTAHAEQAWSATTTVAFRAGLSDEDRADLDRCCAWPKALVEDPPGRVSGLLMPLIPAEFFCQQTDPDSGQPTSRPRSLAWLAASTKQRDAAKVDIPERSE